MRLRVLLSFAILVVAVLIPAMAQAQTSADLAVTKADTPDPVLQGGNITYTITVTNNGPDDAFGVSLSDDVPVNTTFVSFTAPAGWTTVTPPFGGTGTVTATIGTLPVSGPLFFTFVVNVDAPTPGGTVISNAATIVSTADPEESNDVAIADTTVAAAGDLTITKTDSPDPVLASNNITYTITITNPGQGVATNVALTDTVPANTTFVSVTAPAGWTTTTPPVGGTGVVTVTNPSMGVGSEVFTLVVNVNAGTSSATLINNTATVSSPDDTDPTNNSSTTSTSVIGAVPTMGEMTLLAFGLLLLAGGAWMVRRRLHHAGA